MYALPDTHWRLRCRSKALPTQHGLSVTISSRTSGLWGTSSTSSARVASQHRSRGEHEPATTVVVAPSISGAAVVLFVPPPPDTDSASTRLKLLGVSQSQSAATRSPPPVTRMTGCQCKETFLSLVFFFHHSLEQPKATHQIMKASKSSERNGQSAEFLAWNSFHSAWDGSRLNQWTSRIMRTRRR